MPVAEDPLAKIRENYSFFQWEMGPTSKTKFVQVIMKEANELAGVDLTTSERAEVDAIVEAVKPHLGIV